MEVNILSNIQKRNEEKTRELAEKLEAIIREKEERQNKMRQEMFQSMNRITEKHFREGGNDHE